jgi:hypothetical protein
LYSAYNGNTLQKVFSIKAKSLTTFTSYITDIYGTEKEFSTIKVISRVSLSFNDKTGSWIKWITGVVAIDLAANKVNMLWMSPSEYISASVSANTYNFRNLVWKPAPFEPHMMYFGVDYPNGQYTAFAMRSTLFGDKIEPHLFPFVLGTRTRIECIIYSSNWI